MSAYKIAVMGDETSVSGFRPLGFAVFPVDRSGDARELWPEVVGSQFGAVFVTESVYAEIADLVAETADMTVPSVTVIPSAGVSASVGAEKLDRAIERALGTSMPNREEEG